MTNPFATPAMAEGYARSRPPLHARIVARACELIGLKTPVALAIDLGCGSGLSMRPLLKLAERVIGLDPAHAMVVLANQLAAPALAVTAEGEAVPLRPGSVDLMTAAGSLNYSNPDRVLPEIGRVLRPDGVLCAYDFSQGRGSDTCPSLADWFAEFERRYPRPESEALLLDPEIIASRASGFSVVAAENLRLSHRMSKEEYCAYLMTETNVAAALRQGAAETAIREWIEESLTGVFGGAEVDVTFTGYIVCLRPA